MENKIKDIFNEDEWQAINQREKELSEKVKELPMHVEIDQDRMANNNEQCN